MKLLLGSGWRDRLDYVGERRYMLLIKYRRFGSLLIGLEIGVHTSVFVHKPHITKTHLH
jgi:hypothetical protein